VSMLVKATSLSSDSDSSGLANDCSDGEGSSEHIDEGNQMSFKARLQTENNKDKDTTIVSLMKRKKPDREGQDILTLDDDDDESRIGKFCNQFATLYKRSFLCISRDMVRTSCDTDYEITITGYLACALL